MEIKLESVWIIMSKDRSVIAVGTPRNRKLVKVADLKKQRVLTYRGQKAAESAFKKDWFWNETADKAYDGVFNAPIQGRQLLEAVQVEAVYKTL